MGKGSTFKAKGDGRPSGVKPGSGPWNEYMDRDLEGVCPNCGLYEQEMAKDGFCRREECIHDRRVKAIKSGHARMMPDGMFIWNKDGKKIFDVE